MKTRVFARNPLAALAVTLAPLLATAVVFAGITQTREADRTEGVRLLQEAITRADSMCIMKLSPQMLCR